MAQAARKWADRITIRRRNMMIGCTDIVAKEINVGRAFVPTRFFRQPERKCVDNKCPPYACSNALRGVFEADLVY